MEEADYLMSENEVERVGAEIVERAKYRYPTHLIAKALHQSCGMVYIAARLLGCAPVTIYSRMKEYPELQEVIDQYRGVMIDEAEVKLRDAVLNGEPWAIQLVLRGPGKERGYTERAELTGSGGKPIVHEFEVALKKIYGGGEEGSRDRALPAGGE